MIFKDPPSPIINSEVERDKIFIKKYVDSNGIQNKHVQAGFAPFRFCLVTTLGSVSNTWRRKPLYYLEYNNCIYFIASNHAKPNNPKWYNNMFKNPIVWIERDQTNYWAICKKIDKETDADLYNDIWTRMENIYPFYNILQKNCHNRTIPIVQVREI